MTTKKKLLRLRELRDQSGERLFERLEIAVELMADQDWLAEQGDDLKAMDLLESEYFADLCGTVNMSDLFKIRREFPDVSVWQKNKWNLRAMLAELREREQATKDEGEKRERWSCTQKEFEEAQEQAKKLEQSLTSERELRRDQQEEINRLRAELVEVRRENAVLEGRLHELEKMLGDKLAA